MGFRFILFAATLSCLFVCIGPQADPVRTYEVRRAITAPVVDGIVDEDSGEWSNAAPLSGDFVVLDTGESVPEHLTVSFQALHTESHLFLLVTIHDGNLFTILSTGDDSLGDDEDLSGTDTGYFYASLGDDLEIFFDPAIDVARNNDPPSNTPDQYHIAITLESTHADPLWGFPGFDDGKRDVGDDEVRAPYQFSAAGYDLPLMDGNPNVWDPALQIGITLKPDNIAPDTVIVELAVPFEDLNFTGDLQTPTVLKTDGQPDDSLVVAGSPRDGAHWAFQMGRLTNEGDMLVWNQPDIGSLHARPFGELVFVEETPVEDWVLY
ncbi:MAG: hypothetical protein ABIH23_25640 [bacterium]